MAVNKLESMNALSDKLFNNSLNKMQKKLDKVTSKMQERLKDFSDKVEKIFSKLYNRIDKIIDAVKKMSNKLDSSSDKIGNSFKKIQKDINKSLDKSLEKVRSFSSNVNESFNSLKDFSKGFVLQIEKDSPKAFENFSNSVSNLTEKLQFTKGLQDNETMLRQMGVTNPEEVNAQAHSLEKRWGDASNSVLKTANAMSQGLGYSMEMSMSTLENFYEKGGNLNGDMLEQLQNSLPQIKKMGMSVEDYLGVMTNGAKKGMSSENTFKGLEESIAAIESLDKNRLNEITSTLNIDAQNLEGKSSFDILQTMLKEANDPVKKTALTSIFTETGQEAGINFMLGLGGTDVDPSKLENFKRTGDGIKDMMASVESYIADKAGGILPYLEAFSSMNELISPVMSTLTSLNKIIPITTILTEAWAIVQGFLNGVMALNPVSLIVLAIIALVAYIAIAINYYDEWGAAMLQFLGPIGWVINAFMAIKDHWDSIVEAFKVGGINGIIGGFMRIRIVLIDAFLKPLKQILETIEQFDPTGLSTKALKRIHQIRVENKLITDEEQKGGQLPSSPLKSNIGEPTKLNDVKIENPINFNPFNQNNLNQKATVEQKNLYDGNKTDRGLGKSKGFTPQKTKEDINSVTQQASQEKRIEIKIDSFIKGGVQVSNNGQGNGMSSTDLETWFKEMFQRIIINAENATN
ncbi:phage tail tape measure protein [Empedobacter sp. UBA7248]|uniref:phage tail tape measure protein n=1 Tax=Empedobacter sp. UBA7248 TaxID=1946448 RepID=UPI0025B7B517|nr:phage tail tape measure protein [Empedobacter sp. UBA7248]